jgi:hypothetical protein
VGLQFCFIVYVSNMLFALFSSIPPMSVYFRGACVTSLVYIICMPGYLSIDICLAYASLSLEHIMLSWGPFLSPSISYICDGRQFGLTHLSVFLALS